jgi:hypothetical protein
MAARSTEFRTFSEPEASVAAVALEKNHGKEEAAWMTFAEPEA